MYKMPFQTMRDTQTHCEPLRKFVWSKGDTEKFQSSLSTVHIQNDLQSIIIDGSEQSKSHPKEYIDTASKKLIETISFAAKSAGVQIKSKPSLNNKKAAKKTSKSKPWFNHKCNHLKNHCSRLSNLIKKDPFNRKNRFEYNRIKQL